jgi:hypothetical protein
VNSKTVQEGGVGNLKLARDKACADQVYTRVFTQKKGIFDEICKEGRMRASGDRSVPC